MKHIEQIKTSLDKLSDELDADTIKQLDQIRSKAISYESKSIWYHRISWPMLTPTVIALVLVAVILLSTEKNINLQNNDFLFDDLELLSDEIDTELIEDLEFVAWLEAEDIFAGEAL
jgi:hypothetical protein